MADVKQTLKAINEIQGAVGAALVDYENGMCLGVDGNGKLDLEVAAAGNTEVVRAKLRVMEELGIEGDIQDILITLEEQYHIIRPIPKSSLFLYVAIDRKTGNLALARHKIKDIEPQLKI